MKNNIASKLLDISPLSNPDGKKGLGLRGTKILKGQSIKKDKKSKGSY